MKNSNRYVIVISPLSFIYLLLTVLFVWVVYHISWILISLSVAGIFAIALNPIVTSIEKKIRVNRAIAVAIVVVAIIAVFVAILALVAPTIVAQAKTLSNNWPNYSEKISQFAHNQSYTQYLYEKGVEQFNKNTTTITSNVASISLGLAGGFFSFLTFFIFLIYMLASGRQFAVVLSSVLPKKTWRDKFVKMMHDISNRLGGWLRGQAILCLVIFIVSYIGLTVLGVDYSLTLALFAGLMEAVPMVGAYLGAIPAVLVALLTGSPLKAAVVAIFFLIIQQLEGNLLVPHVMNKAVGVHPMLILLAAMIGGTLLGFVGVLIAVPVTAAASVVLSSLSEYYFDQIEK